MKRKFIIMIIGLLIIGAFVLLGFKYDYDLKQTDSYKFNSEYHFSINNNVKYINMNKALEILKEDQAVLYIGDKDNETCQKIVPLLVDVINKYQVKNFYYLDISDEQSSFDVVDDKIVKIKDGSEDYYKLLEILDPILKENIIKKENKEYKTGEKMITLPLIITIKNGEIKNYHEGTVSLEKNQILFDEKNKEQRLKLIDIYSDMINEIII